MKRSFLVLGLLLAGFGQARAAVSINLYNTGVDSDGVVLPDSTVGDLHYALTLVPADSTTTLIRTGVGGYPIPPYVPDDSASAWIGPNNDHVLDGPGGQYIYETTFNLTGLDPSSAKISGLWATDNAGMDILVNGQSTGFAIPYDAGGGNYSFLSFHQFRITSGFQPGLNTLDFAIMNGNGQDDQYGPTGVRVEMTGTANVISEPASLVLVPWSLLGLSVMGWSQRPKK